jgi:predicted transcriptional regulator
MLIFAWNKELLIMNALELRSDLHELIDRVNDISMLSALKTILSKQTSESDFWEELPLNVQESVKRGMRQVENGETRTHEEVMQKHKKWL